MPLRRVKKRRTSRKKKTGSRYFRRPAVVSAGPVPPSIRRRLKQTYFVNFGTTANGWQAHYINLGFIARPAAGGNQFNNIPQLGYVDSPLSNGPGQYPTWYPFYYNTYNQYIQLGAKYKVTFLFESFPSTLNTLCSVGTWSTGCQNGTQNDFPFRAYNSWWDADMAKFKWLRGINENSGDGNYITFSGRVDCQSVQGEPIYDDRYRSICAPPGSANKTTSDINLWNPGTTSSVSTLAFLATSSNGAATSRTWPTLFVELVHDVYFFDRRQYPLSWVPT